MLERDSERERTTVLPVVVAKNAHAFDREGGGAIQPPGTGGCGRGTGLTRGAENLRSIWSNCEPVPLVLPLEHSDISSRPHLRPYALCRALCADSWQCVDCLPCRLPVRPFLPLPLPRVTEPTQLTCCLPTTPTSPRVPHTPHEARPCAPIRPQSRRAVVTAHKSAGKDRGRVQFSTNAASVGAPDNDGSVFGWWGGLLIEPPLKCAS